MEEIIIANRFYQRYQNYILKNFNEVSKKTSKSIFKYIMLNINSLKEDSGLDITQLGDIPAGFIYNNKSRMVDNKIINPEFISRFKNFVKDYIHSERTKNISFNPLDYEGYNNIPLDEYNKQVKKEYQYLDSNDNEMVPNDEYTYNDFLRNLHKNINTIHLFNHNLKIGFKPYKSKLQRCRFKIISRLEDTVLPITYMIICPTCNNVARFTDYDMARDIYCTYNLPGIQNDGHKLKTSVKYVETKKVLYGYLVEIEITPGFFVELNTPIYSLFEFNDSIEELQFLNISLSKKYSNNNFILAISTNDKLINEYVDYNIVKKHKNVLFLDDIFEGVKRYLKQQHNIIMKDDNKIVAYILMFQMLANIYHKKRFYSFIVGVSGSGKSYHAEKIPRLFTGLSTTVNGRVTKNIFHGGTSNMKSSFNTGLIQKGVIGTHEMVIVEEAATALDTYHHGFLGDNLFTMMKESSGQRVPKTSQGTTEYDTKASLFLTGNFEQLKSTDKYRTLVCKKYKELTINKNYMTNWPLFKPIEYYKRVLKNKELAQAHYEIRHDSQEYANKHYILKLPPAEMSRLNFFIAIEDDRNNEFTPVDKNNSEFIGFTHKNQILEELGFNKFNINAVDTKKYDSFFKEILDYINDDFFQKPQNFRISKKNINTHIKISVLDIARSFFIFQKEFYNLPYTLLSEDKKLFENFMRYNYNTLSIEEAKMKKRPIFNNFGSFDESLLFNKIIDNEISKEKEQEEEAGKEVNMNDLPNNDIFGNMEEFS